MKKYQSEYPISVMSRVLGVSRSGYYAWLSCVRKAIEEPDVSALALDLAIKSAHQQSRCTYGTVRLHRELVEQGYQMSKWFVRQSRYRLGLRCKQVKKFKATTNSKHHLPVADNLVMQDFSPDHKNQLWVADITYIHTGEGWLYLAGIKDVFTCEIVGYAIGERMTQELCIAALQLAVARHKPTAGLIHHSDRGSQYCSTTYQKAVSKNGMVASMSRKGNCYDNAPMESFWGSLKNELVHHANYTTKQQAQDEIVEYIEIFYNRQRRHSRLNNLSPAVFIQQLEQQEKMYV